MKKIISILTALTAVSAMGVCGFAEDIDPETGLPASYVPGVSDNAKSANTPSYNPDTDPAPADVDEVPEEEGTEDLDLSELAPDTVDSDEKPILVTVKDPDSTTTSSTTVSSDDLDIGGWGYIPEDGETSDYLIKIDDTGNEETAEVTTGIGADDEIQYNESDLNTTTTAENPTTGVRQGAAAVLAVSSAIGAVVFAKKKFRK